MKLCLVTMFFHHDENCTGLSAYYLNLYRGLKCAGHSTYVVTLGHGSYTTEIDNIIPIRMKRESLLQQNYGSSVLGGIWRMLARFRFAWMAFRRVRALDRSVGLDAVVAPELFGQGFFVALFMRQRLITRLHAPSYVGDRYNRRYKLPLVGSMVSLPERIQAVRSRGLSAASRTLADTIIKDWMIARERIRIIPNAVQIEWIRDLAASQEREIQRPYLLYFGRLERLKGMEVFSGALHQILSRRPDVKMVFVGKDCGYRELILAEHPAHRDQLAFFEVMDKPRLFGLVKHAELIVLPSLSENMSNAGLEAMALAKPVVGTYGTAFEELIRDGHNGFLVAPGDSAALAAKIVLCLERKDLDEIGRNAYQTVLQFDVSVVTAQTVDFYRHTLSGS
jgi:glycosyltransferase involved in cell wall biosynthesis